MATIAVRKTARTAARRWLLAAWVDRAGWSLLAASVVALAVVGLSKVVSVGVDWPWMVAAAVVVGLAVGGALALRRQWSEARAARRLDAALGLRDRLGSALAFEMGGRKGSDSDPFVVLAVRDAEARAAEVSVKDAVRVRAAWAWWGGPAVLVAAGLVGHFVPGADTGARAQSRQRAEDRVEAATDLRRVSEAVSALAESGPADEAVNRELDSVRQVEDELASSASEPTAARADGARAIGRLAERFDARANRAAELSQELRMALSRAANREKTGDAARQDARSRDANNPTGSESLSELAKALRAGDLDAARQEVQKAAQRLDSMAPAEREALAEELREFARGLKSEGDAASGAEAAGSSDEARSGAEGSKAEQSQGEGSDSASALPTGHPAESAPAASEKPVTPSASADESGKSAENAGKQPAESTRPAEPARPAESAKPEDEAKRRQVEDLRKTFEDAARELQSSRAERERTGQDGQKSTGQSGSSPPKTGSQGSKSGPQDGKTASQEQKPGQQDRSGKPAPSSGPDGSRSRSEKNRQGDPKSPSNPPAKDGQPKSGQGSDSQPQPGTPSPSPGQSDKNGTSGSPRDQARPGEPGQGTDRPGSEKSAQPQQPGAGSKSPGVQPGDRGQPGAQATPGSQPQGQPTPGAAKPEAHPPGSSPAPNGAAPTGQNPGDQKSPEGAGADAKAHPQPDPGSDPKAAPKPQPGAGEQVRPQEKAGEKPSDAKNERPGAQKPPVGAPPGPSPTGTSDQAPPAKPTPDGKATPEAKPTPDGKANPQPAPGLGSGLEQLAKRLGDVSKLAHQAQQDERTAREMRKQAEDLLNRATPEERKRLEELARQMSHELQNQPPGPRPDNADGPQEQHPPGDKQSGGGDQPSDEHMPSPGASRGGRDNGDQGGTAGSAAGQRGDSTGGSGKPWADEKTVDARPALKPEELQSMQEREAARWSGDAPKRGEGGIGRVFSPDRARQAASGLERAIEQQSVPGAYTDVVRRVQKRYLQRASGPAPTVGSGLSPEGRAADAPDAAPKPR